MMTFAHPSSRHLRVAAIIALLGLLVSAAGVVVCVVAVLNPPPRLPAPSTAQFYGSNTHFDAELRRLVPEFLAQQSRNALKLAAMFAALPLGTLGIIQLARLVDTRERRARREPHASSPRPASHLDAHVARRSSLRRFAGRLGPLLLIAQWLMLLAATLAAAYIARELLVELGVYRRERVNSPYMASLSHLGGGLSLIGPLFVPAALVAVVRWWAAPPRPAACLICGYDRTGLGADVACPECGEPRSAAASTSSPA